MDVFQENGKGLCFGLGASGGEGGAGLLLVEDGRRADSYLACGLADGEALGEELEEALLLYLVKGWRAAGAGHGRVRGSANGEWGIRNGEWQQERRTNYEGRRAGTGSRASVPGVEAHALP